MINFKIAGAAALLALSPALMTQAHAQRTVTGHGFTVTGGGGGGGGGGFHPAPSGGGFHGGPPAGGTATFAGAGWHGGSWHGGSWGGHRWHRRGWGWGPGIGFATGYPYGCGYYDNCGYYGAGYAYDDGYWGDAYAGPTVVTRVGGGGDVGYCMRRYRSYDPASGTFLGYDGLRHPCP